MVKLAKTGYGPHSSTLFVICVVRLLFVLFYVLFVCKCVLPPGDDPIAVNKYIIYCIYVSKDVRTRRYFLKPKEVREQKRMGKTGTEQSTVDDFFCMSRHSHAIVRETHSLHDRWQLYSLLCHLTDIHVNLRNFFKRES
jgi:hypothetical protein